MAELKGCKVEASDVVCAENVVPHSQQIDTIMALGVDQNLTKQTAYHKFAQD